jgi:hypothetical protein
MAWFGSIHVRTQSVERVITALRSLKQHDCYVGKSGADWVGVYDKRNEDQSGAKLTELARDLSRALSGDYVLGLLQGEEGFAFWLYEGGRQLDTHPRNQIGGLLFLRRPILDLCPHQPDKDRVVALLEPKKVVNPIDFRMTEEELKAEIKRNKARARAMSAEKRAKTTEQPRKIHYTARSGVETLSNIFGIEYYWLVYSDFSPYDLPNTFEHLDFFSR